MANEKNTTKFKMPAVPKGWKEARSNLAGWFARVPGNWLVCILRGTFEVDDRFNKGKKKKVYRLEVVEGNPQIGDAGSGEVANVGDVIGLDETGWTQKLGDYEPGQTVRITYAGKDPADIKKNGEAKAAHKFQILTPDEG